MTSPEPNEEVLLENALARPAGADRAAYLNEVCRGHAPLRRRLEALLRAVDDGSTFLEQPPTQLIGGNTPAIPAVEKAGDRIGRYKLLQPIGEGGCGVVYMAEQEEPIRRRVALKVIKLGMDTKSVVARFEAERQALALMDHPNIAKVLDAGATSAGRPYFVMELVRGVRLTEYCDQHRLSVRDRLDLFLPICHAIQHAHQKGIIHRDIKPSNVLVTMHDGVPVPKVIDFGIAKATDQRLTDQTFFTQFNTFIGTPAYMSPEQAELSGLDIDTRSDIYSLGVLLYELLTGVTPFDPEALFQRGLDEMRRVLREEEPRRPSTRLSTLAMPAAAELVGRRRESLPALVNLVRGDLDWIVMKALEKDRARRYETASGLAADLQRHLGNEPVLARPPSSLYRLQKAVRRHRLAFVSATIVFVALAFGLGLTTWMFFQERAARQRAVAAEEKSRDEAFGHTEVALFLQDILSGAGEEMAQGGDARVLRRILDRAVARVNDLTRQPGTEISLRQTIGNTYLEIGDLEKAEEALLPVTVAAKKLAGPEHVGILHAWHSRGLALLGLGRLDEAEQSFRDYFEAHKMLSGGDAICVVLGLEGLGQVHQARGRQEKAQELFQEASRIRKEMELGDTLQLNARRWPKALESAKPTPHE